MAFQKGVARPPNAGRKPGSRNKRSLEIEAWARSIVEHPAVRAQLATQAQAGALPIPLLQMLFYYAYGKPIERHEVTGEEGAPLVLRVVYDNAPADEERPAFA